MTQNKSHKRQIGVAVIVAAIAIGAVGIGTSYASGSLWGMNQAQISTEEAVAIAISHLDIDSSNLVAIEMEKEGESFTYEVEFEVGQQEISVEIDPQTGEVLEVEQEPLEEDFDENDDD